jgi:hypothetical protein
MSNSNLSIQSTNTNASDSSTAIRAAYKASVRKKKSFHRSSWTQGPVSTRENFPIGAHQLKYSTAVNPSVTPSISPISDCPRETGDLDHLNPVLKVVPPTFRS